MAIRTALKYIKYISFNEILYFDDIPFKVWLLKNYSNFNLTPINFCLLKCKLISKQFTGSGVKVIFIFVLKQDLPKKNYKFLQLISH